MTSIKYFWRGVFLLTIVLLTGACNDLFDYSPYEVRVPRGDRKWNTKQLERLESDTSFKSFRIALIADTHTEYDDFLDFIDLINAEDSVDFIINNGDITLSGISKEFTWYKDLIDKINIPIITVVGNHDYLSNGVEVYETMFGETNFSFVYNNCKFVVFDDIVWENPKGEINYDWLDSSLVNDMEYTHVIPFSHIPPWDQQMDRAQEWVLNYIYGERNSIPISFHGHVHKYLVRHYEDSITKYVCAPNMKRREFLMLNIDRDSVRYEHIAF